MSAVEKLLADLSGIQGVDWVADRLRAAIEADSEQPSVDWLDPARA